MADATTSTRGRDPETIRRDIEHTRDDMDETVAALGDRLSPGRLVDEAWHRIKGGDGGGLGAAARDHPVPLALMGLGVAWLAIEQVTGRSGSSDDVGPGTHGPAEGRRGPYGPDAVDHHDPDWEHSGAGAAVRSRVSSAGDRARDAKERASDTASSLKAKAGDAAASVREKASDAASSVRSKARDLKDRSPSGSDIKAGVTERTSETADRVKHRARRTGEKAKEGFWGLMEDSPLTVGAITFGLGLASGLAAPSTRAEDKAMGRTADTLKDEVERVGRDTAGKAKRVAQDATGAALDEAHRQVESTTGDDAPARHAASELAHEAKTAAKSVGRAAKDAASDRAEQEDLTAGGVKREAKKAAERTRDEAAAERDRMRGGDGRSKTPGG